MSKRRAIKHEKMEIREGRWLTSYGDMMTNLMMFFTCMFALGLAKQNPFTYQEYMREIQSVFSGSKFEKSSNYVFDAQDQKTAEEVRSFTHLQMVNQNVGVSVSEEKYKVILTAPILFDPGQVELKERALPILDAIAEVIKKMPYDVMIEGYTDDQEEQAGGKYQSNWDLSAARAFSVLKYIISKGIQPARLSGAGYGQFRPAYPNDTPENRALNRRIEINVIRSER